MKIYIEKDIAIDMDAMEKAKDIMSIKELMNYRDEIENHMCSLQSQIDRINNWIGNKKIEDITPKDVYIEYAYDDLIDMRFSIDEEIKAIDKDGRTHSFLDFIVTLRPNQSIDDIDIVFFSMEQEEVVDLWHDGKFCNIDKEMIKRRCKEIFIQELMKQLITIKKNLA